MSALKRRYKMSDGSLAGSAQQLTVAADRDVTVLTEFGWDQVRIDALKAMRIDFSDLPTDIELSSLMMEATAAKNLVRKNATNHCAVQIILRVTQHFGEDSTQYRRFNVTELYSATDNDFWFALKTVKRQASALLAQLAGEGLQQSHIARWTSSSPI